MWRVVLAAAGVAIPVGVGALCGVNLARPLLTAMSRAAVQLTLLGGLILAPLMRSTSPLLIFSYAMLMILVAGREASSKLPWRYSGVKVDSLIAAAGGAGVAAFAGITLVIQPSPW
jgi:ABC-type iron transport system FetAB permease component